MKPTGLLLLAAFFSAVSAGPISQQETQCATTCTDDSNKFGYETGRTYIYSYEAKAKTTVPGTNSQESELYLRTRVKIDVLSRCNLVLRLLDVSLENSSPDDNWRRVVPPHSQEFIEALQANSLPFAFQDGRVEHICPHQDEPAWVLNIKRGVLSVLQNNMKNFENDHTVTETDVSGTCSADYKVAERGWSSTTVKKTKDLLACQDRHAHQSALQSLPYQSSSPTQSLPILKSIHECAHTIKAKRLDTARCEEQHVFRPFANGNAGVTTTIVQVLTYESEETLRARSPGSASVRSSLLFDHDYKGSGRSNQKEDAERALSLLCHAAQDDIRPEVPALFSKLVHKLRELDYTKLQDIFNNLDTICNGNTKSRKFFLDGLQMTFTADAIELMKDLITQNEISDVEADVWLLSTAFVPLPTKAMIKSLTKLIEPSTPRQKAVLGLSAMVHTYCRQHECETDPELQLVLRKFVDKLDKNCNVKDSDDQTKTLVLLKAIGNMGFGKTTIPHLERCYKEKENPVEVRIAAVEALRRMPCGTKYSDMLHIFADAQEDTEVRIAGYLLLMKCPTQEIIYTIKELLQKEELNQVYSFVWTHLTNIQESVDPCKRDVRELLQNQVLKRKFSTDSRKFSQAFEKSLHSEALNSGVHAEGSLIFSQKSFLPRSASFNLTVDLFGNSINLFEVGGRVEGFEHLVESFFGPNGYYPEKSVNKILRNLRGKRSVDNNKLTGMEEKFRARSQIGHQPKGSMFLRVFGNDLHYTAFDGWNNRDGTGFYDLMESVLRQEEVDITKSFTFLDSSIITPTAMGLPMNLTVNGTASINLQMKGHMDLEKIANLNCDVTGYIKPSAAVQVTGTMAMDAFIMQTGLKLQATLHTSTAMSGKVELRRGELVNIQLDAPREKMEIINVNTEVMLLTGDKEITQQGIRDNLVDIKHCSGRMTTRPLGFEVCAELKYPNASLANEAPYFPLTGPAGASLYLRKTDSTLTQYAFEYRWQNEKKGSSNQYVRTRRLSFNTPGSSMDRDFTAEVIVSEPEHSIRAAIRTPFKKIGLTGKYSNEADFKKLDGSFSIDNEDVGVIQAALQIERDRSSLRLQPLLFVRAFQTPLVALKGYMTAQKGQKIGVDLTLEHVTAKPIVVQADITKSQHLESNRYEIITKVKSHLLTGSVKGHVLFGEKQYTSSLTTEYSVEGRPKKQYDISTKYRDNSSSSGLKHSANLEIQGTNLLPLFLDWDLHTSNQKVECVLELTRGSGHRMKKIVLTQSLSRENDEHMHKMIALMRASCPSCGIEWGLQADHQYNDSALTSRITVEHTKGQKASIQLDAYKTMNVLLNIGTTLNFNYPGHDMKFSARVKKPTADEIYGSVNAELPNKKLTAKANYRQDRNYPDSSGHEVNAEFNFPTMHPIIMKGNIRTGKQMAASAEYEYEQNHYSVSADYDRTSGADHTIKALVALPKSRYDAEGSLSIQPHESHMIANLQINKKRQIHFEAKYDHQSNGLSGSVDLKWDDKNHSNKRAFFSFDVKTPDLGYEVTAIIKCPQHSTRIEFLTKTEGKLTSPSFTHTTKGEFEWDQNKIAASLDINQVRRGSRVELYIDTGVDIPQIGLHKPSMSYSHTLHDDEFNLEAKYQHQDSVYVLTSNNRIKLFPNFQSLIKLVRPNEEPLQLAINFQMSERKFAAKVQATNFELLVSGDNKSGRNNCHYTGTVMMKTSDMYRFSLDFKRDEHKITTSLSAEHNVRTWSAVIEGEIHRDESKTDLVATVNVSSQITKDSNPSTINSVARYSNDGSNLSSLLEITFDHADRFAVELVGSKQLHNQKINVAGSIHVVSTFGPMKDTLVIGSFECGNGQSSSSLEFKWDDEKAVTVKLEVKTPSIRNLKLSFLLTTPIDLLDRLSFDIQHSLTDKLETTLDAAYNDNTVSLEIKGLFVNNSAKPSISGTAILRTSFKQIPELQASFSHVRSKDEFNNRLQLSWGQSTATVTHTGMFKDWLNFHNSLNIKSPYKGFEVVAADARQLYTNNRFTHQSLFDVDSDNKYQLQLTVDSSGKEQSNGFKQQIRINIITPSKTYGPFQLDIAWKEENGEQIGAGAFEIPTGQRVELSGVTSFGKRFGKGMMKMITPFAGWDNVILSGMYDANDTPTKVSFALQWSPENRIELTSILKLSDTEGNIQLTGTTPFTQYKKVSLGLQYNADFESQLNKIYFAIGDQKYEAELVSLLNDQLKFVTTLTVKTPIRGWEMVRMEFCLQQSKGYAHVAIDKNDKQFKVAVTVNLGRSKTGELSLEVYTPFDDYQVMKAILNYAMEEQKLNLLLKKENISAALNISKEVKRDRVRVLCKMTSAYFNVDAGIEGTWHTEDLKSSIEAVANYNADKITVRGSVTTPDNNILATVMVNTPFDAYEKLEGILKIDRSHDENIVSAKLDYQSDKFEVVVAWSLLQDNSHASFSLLAPFLQDVLLSAQYDVSTPSKTAVLVASYGTESIKLSANIAREYTRLEGYAKLKVTSRDGNRDYSISFNEDLAASPQYTVLTLKANEHFFKIMGTLETTKSPKQNKGQLNLIIDGSMFEHKNNGFELTYDMALEKSVYLVGTFRNKKFELNVKDEGSITSVSIDADFSPFENYHTLSVTAVYKSQESKNNIVIAMKSDNEVTELTGTLLVKNGHQELTLTSKSTQKFLEAMEVVAGFNIDGPEKSIVLTASNEEKKVDLRGILRYDDLKAIATLFLTTSEAGYESVVLQGEFDVSQAIKTSKFTIQNGDDRSEATMVASNTHGKVELKLDIKTPYNGYEDISILANYDITNQEKSSRIVFHWAQDKEIKLTSKLVLNHMTGDARLTFTTPFQKYEKTDITLRFNLQGSEKNIDFSIEHNNVKTMGVFLNILIEHGNGNLNINIITPFRHYDHFELTADYDFSQPEMNANAICTWTSQIWKEARFSYKGNGGIKDSMYMKLDPATENGDLIEFKSSYDFSSADKKVKMVGIFFGETTKFTSDINADQLTINIALQSPYPGYELISLIGDIPFTPRGRMGKLNGKWNDQSMNVNFLCKNNYCTTDNEVKFSLKSRLQGWEEVSATLKYNFASSENYELELSAKQNENWLKFVHSSKFLHHSMELVFTFTSTIPQVPILSLGFNLENSNKKGSTKLALQYAEGKAIKLSGEIDFRKDLTVAAKMNTPIPNYKSNELIIQHRRDRSNVTGSIVGTHDTERAELSGYISYSEPDVGNMRIMMNTPFTEPSFIIGSYDLTKQKQNVFLNVQVGKDKFETHGNLNVDGTKAAAELSINTPFQKLKTFDIEFELTYQQPIKHLEITLKLPKGDEIQLKGDFEARGNTYISSNFTMKTPFNNLESLDVKSLLRNEMEELGGLLALRWSDEKQIRLAGFVQPNKIFFSFESPKENIKLSGVLINEPGMFQSEGSLERGRKNIVSFSANAKYNHPRMLDFSAKIVSVWDKFPELDIIGSYQMDGEFHSQLDIKSPFQALKYVHAECVYQHTDLLKDAISLKLEIPDDHLRISLLHSDFSKFYKAANIRFKIESSFVSIPNVEFDLKTKFTDPDAHSLISGEISLTLTLENLTSTLSYSLNISRSTISCLLHVDCPWISDRTLSSNISGSYDEHHAEVTGSVDTPDGTYSLNGNIQYDDQSVNGKLKLNNQSDIVFNCDLIKKEITATVTIEGKPHHVAGSYQMKGGLRADLMMDSPLMKVKSISFRYYLHPDSIDGLLKITTNSATHRISFSIKSVDLATSWHATVETPLVAVNRISTEGKIVVDAHKGQIEMSFTTPKDTHKLAGSVNMEKNVVTAQLSVETPLLNVNTFTVTFRVSNNRMKNISIEASLTTTNTVHSVSATFINKENKYQGQIKLKTPVFSINTISVNGMYAQVYEKTDFIVSVKLPQSSHNFSSHVYQSSTTFSGDFKLETPTFNINTISLSVKVPKQLDRDFESSVTLETSDRVHVFEMSIFKNKNVLETTVQLQTPALNIGFIGVNSKIVHQSLLNTELSVTLDTHRSKHSVNLSFQKYSKSMVGEIKLDLPILNIRDFKIILKILPGTEKGHFMEMLVTTERHQHKSQASLHRMADSISSSLILDSPLVEPIKINVNVQGKCATGSCRFDAEIMSGDKAIKINGDYRTHESNIDASINIDTPFKNLENIRSTAHYKTDQSSGVNAAIEVQTSNPNFDVCSIQITLQPKHNGVQLRAVAQTPFTVMKTVKLEGNITFKPTREATQASADFIVTIPQGKYRMFGQMSKSWQQFSIDAGLEWNTKKTELSITAIYEPNNWEGRVRVDTPFLETIIVDLNASTDEELNSRKWQGAVEHGSQRYSVNLDHSTENARLEVISPYNGYESTSMAYSRARNKNAGKEFIFSVEYGTKSRASVTVQVNPTAVQIKIRTTVPGYENLDMYFDSKENGFKTEIILNDQSLLEIHYQTQDGQHVMRVTTPHRPMMASFIRHKTTEGWMAKGEFSYNLNKKSDSTYGLELEKKRLVGGYNMLVRAQHGRQITTLSAQTQKLSSSYYHKTELIWDQSNARGLAYSISIKDSSNSDKIQHDIIASLNYLVNSYELLIHHEKSHQSLLATADFKWGIENNNDKHIGVKFDHQHVRSGRRQQHKAGLIIAHHKLETDLVLRGEMSSYNGQELFHLKTDLEYSRNQNQHLQFELKLKEDARHRYNAVVTLRHPESKLDLLLETEAAISRNEIATRAQFKYMDRFGNQHNTELQVRAVQQENEVVIEVKFPDLSLTMKGNVELTEKESVINIQGTLNDELPITAKIQIDRTLPNILMKVLYNPRSQKQLTMAAGMPTQKLIKLEVFHDENDQRKIQDVLFVLQLNNSRVLDARATWQMPHIFDAINIIADEYSNSKESLYSASKEASSFAEEELQDKVSRITSSIANHMQPLAQDLSDVLSTLEKNTQFIVEYSNKMYRDNHFFSKDILDGLRYVCCELNIDVSQYLNSVRNWLHDALHQLKLSAQKLPRWLGDTIPNFLDSIENDLQEWRQSVHQWTQDSREATRAIHRVVANAVVDILCHLHDKVRPLLQTLSPLVKNYIERVCDRIQNLVDATAEYMADFMIKGRQIPVVANVLDVVDDLAPDDEVVKTFRKYYDAAIGKGNQIIEDGTKVLDRWSSSPPVQYATDVAKDTYQRASWAYDYWNVEDNVKSAATRLYSHTRDFLMDLVHDLAITGPYVSIDASHTTEFNPDMGHFRHTQQLPVDWHNFAELPNFSQSPELHQVLDWKDKAIAQLQKFSFWDTYNQHKSKFTLDQILPPFDTYAMLAGKQHYMTFDKRFFEFAGQCSYLLAHDFVDRNFTAIVNYEGEAGTVTKKSLFLMFRDTKIEIGTDFTVTLNKKKTELPIQIEDVTVTREASAIIVRTTNGVQVTCNFGIDVCIVRMVGWYFGKTGGMFGTYDNEPQNDFVTPDRKKVDDVVQFASSWEVGSTKCRTSSNLATQSSTAAKVCTDLFKSSDSPLRSCFYKVLPDDFHTMCANDVADYSSSSDSSRAEQLACASVAAYVTRCNLEGAAITMPDTCVKCNLPTKGIVKAGEEVRLKESAIPRSADVVFIVEEKDCNKNIKLLQELVKGIEAALQTQNLQSNRYALIGFGGDGVHDAPHIHTANGQIFSNERSIVNLAFSSIQTGDGNTDLLAAIRMAAHLSYRAAVAKTVMALPCSDSTHYSTADYDIVHHMLKKQNIKLHVFAPSQFEMKSGKRARSKEVIGIDSNAAYTVQDVQDRELQGDVDLRAQVVAPQTVPVSLALHSNGSVFARPPSSAKPRLIKMAQDVFVRRVALTTSPAPCQKCHCQADKFGEGQAVCVPCNARGRKPYSPENQELYQQLRDYTERAMKKGLQKSRLRVESNRGGA